MTNSLERVSVACVATDRDREFRLRRMPFRIGFRFLVAVVIMAAFTKSAAIVALAVAFFKVVPKMRSSFVLEKDSLLLLLLPSTLSFLLESCILTYLWLWLLE